MGLFPAISKSCFRSQLVDSCWNSDAGVHDDACRTSDTTGHRLLADSCPKLRPLLDEVVYADMVQVQYDSSRWMGMQPVLAAATQIPRSKKKLDELCRKRAILIHDTLTMRKIGRDGIAIIFSATVSKVSLILPSIADIDNCSFTDRSI